MLTLAWLFAGCSPAPGTDTAETMTEQSIDIGEWIRVGGAACAESYPDRIDFRDGGIYIGRKEPEGTFTQWDAGTWRVVEPGRVEISTANDAVLSYGFSVADGVLSFRDADGCEFRYRRAD